MARCEVGNHYLAHQTFTGPEDLDQAIQEAIMKLNLLPN